jgi:hypothetical protein
LIRVQAVSLLCEIAMSPCPYRSVSVISKPPRTGHYGWKTCSGLVKIAQVIRIIPVATWRCFHQCGHWKKSIFMQDDDESGTKHVQFTVVVHEAEFSEFLQKETEAGVCSPDHVSLHVLTVIYGTTIFGVPSFQRKPSIDCMFR